MSGGPACISSIILKHCVPAAQFLKADGSLCFIPQHPLGVNLAEPTAADNLQMMELHVIAGI